MRHDEWGRKDLARRLRRAMTVPEIKLWRWLRSRRVRGAKFRRQHPVGPFIADFYCPEVGLVVELDGATHDLRRDAPRDQFMASLGMVVMRIPVWRFEKDERMAVQNIADRVESLRAEIQRGERLWPPSPRLL